MKINLTINTVIEWMIILLIFSVMTAVSNWVGFKTPFLEGLIGMLILCSLSLIGLIIEKLVPSRIPSIMYISIIGLLIAVPWSPIASTVIYYTSKIDIVSLTTILLAYAGIAMGKDLKDFKKVGFRGIIVTFFVILGTYLCSAVIAQFVLQSQSII